jgi:hypothetical protein
VLYYIYIFLSLLSSFGYPSPVYLDDDNYNRNFRGVDTLCQTIYFDLFNSDYKFNVGVEIQEDEQRKEVVFSLKDGCIGILRVYPNKELLQVDFHLLSEKIKKKYSFTTIKVMEEDNTQYFYNSIIWHIMSAFDPNEEQINDFNSTIWDYPIEFDSK